MTEFQRRLEANIRESLRFAVGEVDEEAVAHMIAGVNAVLNHPCAPAPQEHVAPYPGCVCKRAVCSYDPDFGCGIDRSGERRDA